MMPSASMATIVPEDTRLPSLTSLTRPEDIRISARISAFGPNTPSRVTEFLLSAPCCVAALVTVLFDIECGCGTRPQPLLMSGWRRTIKRNKGTKGLVNCPFRHFQKAIGEPIAIAFPSPKSCARKLSEFTPMQVGNRPAWTGQRATDSPETYPEASFAAFQDPPGTCMSSRFLLTRELLSSVSR